MRVNQKRLSEELEKYLRQEDMSYEAFAERAGIALSTVSRTISMHHMPSLETITAIAEYLRLDPITFIDCGGDEYLNLSKLPRVKYDQIQRVLRDVESLTIVSQS